MHLARLLAVLALTLALPGVLSRATEATTGPSLRKINDVVIYEDARFHSAFPSVVRRDSGELLVAFRRAPDRRLLGEKSVTHTDANSQLVMVRSRDDGRTWSPEPELIYSHPFGGSQDPCLIQLRDRSLVCASYGWAKVSPNYAASLTNTARPGEFAFMGGYVLRSENGGRSWEGPFLPPPVPTNPDRDFRDQPVAAFNRGAMCEGREGTLYWAVAATSPITPRRTGVHLMASTDKGRTWTYRCPIATDPKITFNETSLYETPKGDLVAFLRTANFDDHTVIARSTDHGASFAPWQDAGFQGHPHHALRLPDRRVLLTYGYRHAPFGVRARILNAEATDAATAEEVILRDDGGGFDLGYPWATMLSKRRALVVYYFNQKDGPRHIAGTVIEFAR